MANSLASTTPGDASERTAHQDALPTNADVSNDRVPHLPPYALEFHPDHWP
ncbi:hypothetical protein [Arthrobacter sp. CAN_A1]|uniref:hypothetical protein n=1 Tax=Arthrobacter sp. CAN_A1 TaxID=2787717 RepID=UPI0018CAB528